MGVTNSIDNWKFQDNYVERIMENAAYTSAHPDDTLVLAGPPRQKQEATLFPIGMMQAFQASTQKPIVPVQTIGSGRSFFLSGKGANSWSIGRLFVKGNNLLKALHNNALEAGITPDKNNMDEPAQVSENTNYLVNLDSELFLVPFGLQILFRDKAHNPLGGFYMELCVINSFAVGVQAGQNMIMENVTGLCDRILPIHVNSTGRSDGWDGAVGFAAPQG